MVPLLICKYWYLFQQSPTATKRFVPKFPGSATPLLPVPIAAAAAALFAPSVAQDSPAFGPIFGGRIGRRRSPAALRRRPRRRRHGSAVADAAGFAVVGALALAAQLSQEQLPGQPALPSAKTSRWEWRMSLFGFKKSFFHWLSSHTTIKFAFHIEYSYRR